MTQSLARIRLGAAIALVAPLAFVWSGPSAAVEPSGERDLGAPAQVRPAALTAPLPQIASVEDAVRALLETPDELPLPVRKRAAALLAYYGAPDSRLLWQSDEAASAFLSRLTGASADGLTPDVYPIQPLADMRAPHRLALTREGQLRHAALTELTWSAFFLKFASEIKVGRFLPTKIDPKLYWQAKEIDQSAALSLVAALGSVDAFLAAWEPQIAAYQGLKTALSTYREIEARGGWGTVPVRDGLLKPGDVSDLVPPLRARLAVTDDARPAATPEAETVYDADLVAAVKRFQARHGLDADGVVGKQTTFQLNIPVDARIRQIILSMERWRWMPENLGEHYIIVNIAGYELKRVRGQRVEERMRVVVGKPYHQTPVFSDSMEYVEINPYWNVPTSIAVKEELPKLKTNPGATAAKGIEALSGDRVIPVTSIDWSRYSAANFPFRLRQKPGPANALGRVKFMFPNQFNVYMHDTPARSLFGEAQRAFSHGCIRLARPIDFAEQILSAVPGWDRARIEGVLQSGARTVVSLKQHMPVHLTYSTAWREPDGAVHFRPDIYNRDAKLHAALFGKAYAF